MRELQLVGHSDQLGQRPLILRIYTGRQGEKPTAKSLAYRPRDRAKRLRPASRARFGLIRLKRLDAALVELRLAADLAGNSAQFAYAYGVALHSAGRPRDALAHLKESQSAHPGDREILVAITSFGREAGDSVTALQYAEKFIQDCP